MERGQRCVGFLIFDLAARQGTLGLGGEHVGREVHGYIGCVVAWLQRDGGAAPGSHGSEVGGVGAGSRRGSSARHSGQRSVMRAFRLVMLQSLRPQSGQAVRKRWPGGGRTLPQWRHSEEARWLSESGGWAAPQDWQWSKRVPGGYKRALQARQAG